MLYFIYFVILFVFINLYFKIALKLNIIDIPNQRSSHSTPILRGGGIIIPFGIILWFMWSGFPFPWFFTGMMLISLVSFMDDIFHLKYSIRLILQMISLALLLYQLGLTPFSFWIWILLLFIATGIINAFNFMDGINGITSSYSLSVLLGLWIVNNYLSMFICNDLLYSVMLSIALLGFYNFRTKAYCFAGDVGSVSISFALVFLIGELIISSDNPIYIMFMIIYGIDTFLTIVFRLIRHEKIFDAHRNHLYQILANELSISHLKVSTSYALTQFFINIFLIFIVGQLPKFIQFLISLGIIAILAYTYIYIIGKRFVRK